MQWNTWQAVDTSAVQLKLHAVLSPKLLKEIPNLILSGVRIETIHLTNRTTQKKRHINAATVSSPSSCGVHQCCAMATAWRTASSINTCEHPSNQEIACLSTERLECATDRKHVWCNIDSRCLKTWILQLFHMCFTFHWETLLWRPSESAVSSVTVDRLTGREPVAISTIQNQLWLKDVKGQFST
jgi:hypothetical protein